MMREVNFAMTILHETGVGHIPLIQQIWDK